LINENSPYSATTRPPCASICSDDVYVDISGVPRTPRAELSSAMRRNWRIAKGKYPSLHKG